VLTRGTPERETEPAAVPAAAQPASPQRDMLSPANVLALQRTAGNAAVSRAILARQPNGDGGGAAAAAELQGPENHLGEKIEITADLISLLGDGKDTSEGTTPEHDLSLIEGKDKGRVTDTNLGGSASPSARTATTTSPLSEGLPLGRQARADDHHRLARVPDARRRADLREDR
jgi:hypothetical protein